MFLFTLVKPVYSKNKSNLNQVDSLENETQAESSKSDYFLH